MSTATITSRIIETKLISWNDLQFIQQENYPELNLGDDFENIDSEVI